MKPGHSEVYVSMKGAMIMPLSKLPGLLGLVPDWFPMAPFVLLFFSPISPSGHSYLERLLNVEVPQKVR